MTHEFGSEARHLRCRRLATPPLASFVGILAACGSESPAGPGGALDVTVLLHGNSTVAGGVTVTSIAQGQLYNATVQPGSSVTIEVPPGTNGVSLSHVPNHCWADESVQTVTVVEGTPAQAVFEVTCVGDFAFQSGVLENMAYLGPDGSTKTHVFPGPVGFGPWSPAGTAFLVGESPLTNPKCSMSLFHVATGTVTPVGRADFSYARGTPAWSDTGDRLVLGRTRDCGSDADAAMMLYDATGTTALDSVVGLLSVAMAWRPGTEEVAYSDGTQVRLYSWADGSDTQFSPLPVDPMAWSPDGSRLAVQLTGSGEIAMLDAVGEELFRFGGADYVAFEPQWAADGSGLLFQGVRDQNWDIYYASADASEIRPVTTQPGSDTDASWAGDGGYFLYTSNRNSVNRIYLGNILGLPHRELGPATTSTAGGFRPGTTLGFD